MKLDESIAQLPAQTQQFHRQYGANALLPSIDWAQMFKYSKLDDTQIQALETLYQHAVPLALQVFDELHFDVFEPYAYKPQGLGLFERLAEQENKLIESLEAEAEDLPAKTRHQIWSMLLRGGAVLVFKAWLGKVKNEEDCLDTTQFDELSDLLFIKTCPHELAEHLQVDPNSTDEHVFLMYEDEVYLDRFNSLETAALFVDLGVYDATFLSLRDDRVAEYLISKGYVTQEQIDELQSALNPMFCTDVTQKQDYIA
ncbi:MULTISPECIES: hypothetical protein [Acinetobacter]|uniref:Uncharacterized protein n=1 Tax=Acinetobacter variabilis TaxID=70346 RepID=N9MSK6_9GAMM|nr:MULTISPECIES: hypothetical protein [Acinetobacter]AUX90761.1 hypothetical protein C3F22_13685 [Acinetobacter sp. ACNIH1]ENX11553.1 hypothetical protein F897_00406 [Acinetobacter variabilis]MBO3659709.1 hypothetical protein [Acinetobacter variabilis]MCU4364410.1 hypothetical protein [Acinetobacter variabilis]MCU4374114.1 hypothetical protein [Acinetobacter variabilis]